MSLFTVGWIVLFTAGLALEAVVFFNRRRGDTLSEVTWGLLERRGLRVLFVMGWAWLTVHLLSSGWV